MKLHPTTVVYRGLSRGAALGSVGFFVGTSLGGAAGPSTPVAGPLLSMLLAAVGLLAGVGYEAARYRRFEYELGEETLDIRSGVLSRRRREIPLRRVQNVDVSRSVIQRALGIASVRIETAGGGETEASLECVGGAEADRLQTELRERRARLRERRSAEEAAAGSTTGRPTDGRERDPATGSETEGREAGLTTSSETEGRETGPETEGESGTSARAVSEETLFELSDRDLLALSVLSFDPRALSALVFVVPFVAPMAGGYLGGLAGAAVLGVGLVLAALAGVVIWAVGAAATFVKFYGFRLTRLGDELRYERGLLQRYDGSIPLDKLQTVAIEENLLMRQFGYAALAVETAGYAPGQSPSGGSEAAVPLAPRERVLDLARDVEDVEVPDLDRPPKRAQRRYAGRYALAALAATAAVGAVDAFLVPLGPWYLLALVALLAPAAARARWRHVGHALGAEHAFAREGFWRRRTAVVPYYRVQNVITRRTVFQRRWGLATVLLDTAGSQRGRFGGGDAQFVDADGEDAATRRERVRERLVAALRERRGE